MQEPGLDLHDWETVYSQLADELEDDPRGTLPELYRLVARILGERGFPVEIGSGAFAATDADQEDEELVEVDEEGADLDVLLEFRAAEEVVLKLERGLDDISPGDVAAAIESLTLVYDFFVNERAPGDGTL